MNKPSKNIILLLTAGAFFAFFVFGFSDNLKGAVLPALLQDLHFNYSLGGTILLGIYVGFMAATLSTGFLADAFGQKVVLLLAGFSLAIGLVCLTTFSAPVLLTGSMVFLGFGMGCLELGCNALIINLHTSAKGRYLNLMSVMHGMGSMIAPLYAGWLLTANTSWRVVYRWDLVLIGFLILYFAILRFPRHEQTESEKPDFNLIKKTAFTPRLLAYYFAITVYVATELGIASWIVEYLQKVQQENVNQSTQALSLYFGLIMLGRFIGSFFVEKLGYLKSILFAALGASACLLLSLFGPGQFSLLLPVSGLFLSIIFPTITAATSSAHNENINTILGILFTFGGLGGVIGPWLIGITSDLGGIKFGFGLNLAFALLTAGLAYILLMKSSESA
jgi:fucose permease